MPFSNNPFPAKEQREKQRKALEEREKREAADLAARREAEERLKREELGVPPLWSSAAEDGCQESWAI